MAKQLIIVESPTKARTIERILDKNFEVLSCNGHVIDLPEKELAVEPENGFALKNQVIPSKKKVLSKIKKAAGNADRVLLATDPDREGEAIAYLISQHLKLPDDKAFRILFHEITKSGIINALKNPGKLDENKFRAQQARRAIDRLVGYKLSPILWKKIKRGLSAGRVQSVALRLICEREREILAFNPEDYWHIFSHLEAGQPPNIKARLVAVDDRDVEIKKGRILDGSVVEEISAQLKQEKHIVSDLNIRQAKKSPRPPFITSTLQQEAARKLRFTAKRTMMIAQQLYEGISIGEMGTMGLITYMRTDSIRVSSEAVETARKQIVSVYSSEHVPEKPRSYKNRKGAQDAHEAIRPSRPDLTPERISSFVEKDQLRLYELIYKRFLASQMSDAQLEKTKVKIQAGPFVMEITGERVLFPGFTQLYEESRDEEKNNEPTLPPLAKGQELALLEVEVEEKTTQPPPRYTEATLVKTMEENGIGRPSTYAAILETIQKRNYVSREERRFVPSFLGMGVNDYLVQRFPRLVDTGFTADMENELDDVEEGSKSYIEVLDKFFNPFAEALEEADKAENDFTWGITDLKCPECSKDLVVKMSGKTGEFLACTGYPECRFTSNFAKNPDGSIKMVEEELRTEKCPECETPMVLRQGRGGPFLGCSRYPECKGTLPLTTGIKCPEDGCSGEMVVKRTKKGRTFYGCSAFPKCKFALWDEPVQSTCPSCETPIMTRKNVRGTDYLVCAKKECGYRVSEDQTG
jgi:DNA topoisomerase-1